MKHVLLISNSSWYLYNFRRPLMKRLRDSGMKVTLVSPQDSYSHFFVEDGFQWISFDLHRSKLNPLTELKSIWDLVRIYRRQRPNIVHHFGIKSVLYGTAAAQISRIPSVINAITGLGHAFIAPNLTMRLVRPLVKFTLRFFLTKKNVFTVFQNKDDQNFFLEKNIIDQNRSYCIPTSGVDIELFHPPPDGFTPPRPKVIVLFASRLLREKGVFEFIDAVRELRKRDTAAEFWMAGDVDPGNESSVSPGEMQKWAQELGIIPLGHVRDMPNLLRKVDIFVLPSYREGGSKVILEASACGLPVVTTDVPGCNNLVDHKKTGFIVPAKDGHSIALAIEKLALEPRLRKTMGTCGREKIAREFSDSHIAEETFRIYEDLM